MKNKYVIQVELTNNCNFKCKFCPHSYYMKSTEGGNAFDREKGFMCEELFDIALKNINKYAKRVRFGFFGEQLLHKDFEKFITKFPIKRNYALELNTNWSLTTKENMKALRMFDLVLISFDSSNPELWDELCPGAVVDLDGSLSDGRYSNMCDKLSYWLGLEDRPPTIIVYVVSTLNENDKDVFIAKWAGKLKKQDKIFTKTVISYGGVIKNEYMSGNPCKVPYEKRFTIGWNGDCTPCNLDVNMALKGGNLTEVNDMMEIVKSEKWIKSIENMKNKEGICRNCIDANNRSKDRFHINPAFK